MNVSEEHKQKAREIKIMLSRLEPEVLYHLADFMDFEHSSDGIMQSQDVYEAQEKADVWSEDGKPQDFDLDLGLRLGTIKIRVNFQSIEDGMWDIGETEFLK